jgi:hypothetical protein
MYIYKIQVSTHLGIKRVTPPCIFIIVFHKLIPQK